MYCTCATKTFKSYILPREPVKINDSDHKHDFIGLPLIM